MNENFKIMNSGEIRFVIGRLFFIIDGEYRRKMLKCFANKEGFGQEVIFALFQSDFDDVDQERLPKRLDDEHVLLEQNYPVVEVNEFAYLDFPTFYGYVSDEIKKIVKVNPEESDLLDLLAKVKQGLGV